jgi:hypothetical protein
MATLESRFCLVAWPGVNCTSLRQFCFLLTPAGKPHPVAKEQYCDPAAYFSGKHAACFAAVRQQYAGDVELLQYEPPAALHSGSGSGGWAALGWWRRRRLQVAPA